MPGIVIAEHQPLDELRDIALTHYGVGSHVERSATFCYGFLHTESFFVPRFGLLSAVADGTGGHPGGTYANLTALDLLQTEFFAESRAEATWNEFAECMKRYLEKTQPQLSSRLSAIMMTCCDVTIRARRARQQRNLHAQDMALTLTAHARQVKSR